MRANSRSLKPACDAIGCTCAGSRTLQQGVKSGPGREAREGSCRSSSCPYVFVCSFYSTVDDSSNMPGNPYSDAPLVWSASYLYFSRSAGYIIHSSSLLEQRIPICFANLNVHAGYLQEDLPQSPCKCTTPCSVASTICSRLCNTKLRSRIIDIIHLDSMQSSFNLSWSHLHSSCLLFRHLWTPVFCRPSKVTFHHPLASRSHHSSRPCVQDCR